MKNAAKVAFIAIMMLFIIAIPVRVYAADDSSKGIVKVSGDVYVNEGTTVEGDVVTVWGNIYVNGSVTGNAVAVFGNIIVNGKVLGDATTVRGTITVGQNGKVLGNTVEALGGSSKVGRLPGLSPNISMPLLHSVGAVIFSSVFSLILFILTALVYLIIPVKVDTMANTMDENMGRKIGIGFLALIGSPFVMILLSILLAITVIGIIVIPFVWVAFMAASLVAVVPVYIFIGSKVGELVGKQKIGGYGALAVGILSVWL